MVRCLRWGAWDDSGVGRVWLRRRWNRQGEFALRFCSSMCMVVGGLLSERRKRDPKLSEMRWLIGCCDWLL